MKTWGTRGIVLLLMLFVWYLVPRISSVFEMANSQKSVTTQQEREVKEFDPYAPIVIVPNDYKEGDEIIIEE
jgi:hypothetical protein